MKKIATILVLLFVLSVSAFADGIIHGGGLSCPQDQTEKNISNGRASDPEGTINTGGRLENSIYTEIFDFLKSIL